MLETVCCNTYIWVSLKNYQVEIHKLLEINITCMLEGQNGLDRLQQLINLVWHVLLFNYLNHRRQEVFSMYQPFVFRPGSFIRCRYSEQAIKTSTTIISRLFGIATRERPSIFSANTEKKIGCWVPLYLR